MSGAAFTKGPWYLGPDKDCYRSVNGPKWDDLARVVVRLEGDDTQFAPGEANARLIAAAPDLYEALKAIIEDHPIAVRALGEVTVRMARAALAKVQP